MLTFTCFQANIFINEKQDWAVDKASENRMVYVPKETVVEFMKKVSTWQDLGTFYSHPDINFYLTLYRIAIDGGRIEQKTSEVCGLRQ